MKRRCVPLRADHDLLTPDTHTESGVRLHPAIQGQLEGVSYLSTHRNDSQSAVGASQRCPVVASLNRRLRFEDETETEAESRYLERQRQRRRMGQRGTGALFSKPDLNLYVNVNPRTGPKGAGPVVAGLQRRKASEGLGVECESCRTFYGGGINLNLHRHSPVSNEQVRSLFMPHLNLRTEPIRETYIGSVTHSVMKGGDTGHVSYNQVKKRTNEVPLNGNHMTFPKAALTTDLPINPYPPDQLTPPPQTSVSKQPAFMCPPSSSPPTRVSQSVRLTGTKTEQNLNLQQEPSPPFTPESSREIRSEGELMEKSKQEGNLKSSASFSAGSSSAKSQASSTTNSNSNGRARRPVTAELHSDDPTPSERSTLPSFPAPPFATVKLSRTRSSSLDRQSSKPRPQPPGHTHPDPAPSGNRKSLSLLKKTPSVQSLNVAAPFLPLRKSLSVQNLKTELKKKDRSADYRPADDHSVQRCLSIEDVGRPSSVRSVGRVLQVCSDGTFLLEISRPKNRTFGFIISRGRGRADSGVYVEDMADCSTQKLYAGLLAVGDEIVEVNGEKVVCLSLDQVTRLLTQTTTATIRVLRHRHTPPR